LHKQHGSALIKTFILQGFRTFLQALKDFTICEFEQGPQNRRVFYPNVAKVEGIASPLLSMARSRLLRLHP